MKTDFIDEKDDFVMQILGSCHAAREIEGKVEGDEIDKEAFKFSAYKIFSDESKIITVKNEEGETLQILKINYF